MARGARPGRAQFGMDEHVADEVLQEALLRLFVAYGAGEVVRDPAAWIRRTAKRLLIDIQGAAVSGRPRAVHADVGVPGWTR